jgi:NADH:ubiquinone oxidoreductase subunit F (NADH-binding)
VIDYLALESAGQCGPCVHGLRAIADLFGELADGVAHPGEAQRVLRWSAEIRGRGACHHPDGAARFVESALSVFADEMVAHQRGGCAGRPPSFPVGNGAPAVTGRVR